MLSDIGYLIYPDHCSTIRCSWPILVGSRMLIDGPIDIVYSTVSDASILRRTNLDSVIYLMSLQFLQVILGRTRYIET